MSNNKIVAGYIDRDLLIKDNNYYVYIEKQRIFERIAILSEVHYNSENDFKNYVKNHLRKCRKLIKYDPYIKLAIPVIMLLLFAIIL